MVIEDIDKSLLDNLTKAYENAEDIDNINAQLQYAQLLKQLTDQGYTEQDFLDTRAAKLSPQTNVEKREEKKDVAADEDRSEKPIELKSILDAYNVDMEGDEKKGEVDENLQSYLDKRGVFAKTKNESSKEYVERNINAFKKLGLNWNNKEDRAKLARSIELAEVTDERDDIAEEANSGMLGAGSIALPRVYEQATSDIKSGKEANIRDYVKAGLLDAGEDALMTIGSPVGGAVKAIGKKGALNLVKGGSSLGKNMMGEVAKQKAKNAAGKLATETADAVAVPLIMEYVDAAAYDDDNNARSEASNEDVAIGAGVNLVAPYIGGRKARHILTRLPSGIGENAKIIADYLAERNPVSFKQVGNNAMKAFETGFEPLAINKFGKSDMVRAFPLAEQLVKEQAEENNKRENRAEAQRQRESEWELGFNVPKSKKDRYWNNYQEYARKKLNKPIILDYITGE